MIGVAVKPIETKILEALKLGVEELGFDIVQIQVRGAERVTLEIIIDRLDGEPVAVADCVSVSDYASSVLDVVDPLQGAYTLQVFSPGSERPLTRVADFEKFVGERIKVKLNAPLEGRKRMVGVLEAATEQDLTLKVEGEDKSVALEFMDLGQAKLAPLWDKVDSGTKGKGPGKKLKAKRGKK